MLNATCKDCTKRHIGCHAHCEDYKAFRKQLDEENIRRRQIEQNERLAKPGKPVRRRKS